MILFNFVGRVIWQNYFSIIVNTSHKRKGFFFREGGFASTFLRALGGSKYQNKSVLPNVIMITKTIKVRTSASKQNKLMFVFI